MSDTAFKSFLSSFLNMAASKLAEMNEPLTAEALSELTVKLVASQLSNPALQIEMARALVPFVQAWLDGKD
jgi:hypothetical protein